MKIPRVSTRTKNLAPATLTLYLHDIMQRATAPTAETALRIESYHTMVTKYKY